MRRFLIGNLYLVLSMVSAVGSQMVLKALIDEVQPLVSGWQEIPRVFDAPRFTRLVVAGVLLVVGYAGWVLSLTKLNLSYAYPVACCSVLVAVGLSVIFLGETVSPRQWVGTILLLVGCALLMPANG